MISLVSFLIVLLGTANWASIGLFQYDFVAGLFGSQASIFSRTIYIIVGVAGVWLVYSLIKQKGKIYVNTKKNNDKELLEDLKETFSKKDKVDDNDDKKSDTLKNENTDNDHIQKKFNNPSTNNKQTITQPTHSTNEQDKNKKDFQKTSDTQKTHKEIKQENSDTFKDS